MNKIPTGSKILDKMLDGGYDPDIITTIYGPGGSGKTVICLLCAINVARNGKRVIYVDTEGSFSIDRFRQITDAMHLNFRRILNKIAFLRPTRFEEQKKTLEKLKDIVTDKVGLIILDTIAMLYRLELGRSEDVYEVNRELGKQIGYLTEITRKKHIPVLITNQVYSDFDDKDQVKIVGGDLLKYGSKCLIELQITPSGNRRAVLKKHRSLMQEREITFKIVEGGIIGTKEGKGFRFF